MIEGFQRKALRMIEGYKNLSYEDRFKQLNLVKLTVLRKAKGKRGLNRSLYVDAWL